MSPEFPSTQTAGTASALFSRFNDRVREGELLTIDALCAEHPEHAAELREMHSIHRGLVQSLETEGLRARDAADPAAEALLASYQGREALFASRYRIDGTLGSGGMGDWKRSRSPERTWTRSRRGRSRLSASRSGPLPELRPGRVLGPGSS